ncbi:MAG: DUF5717 family protein [Lachnospiraceae bacterium]
MRERINRLAKGIIDIELPGLRLDPESVDETIAAGEVTRREIFISDASGLHIKGLVYSTNTRVRVGSAAFGGNRNHVTYEVDGTHLNQEDVIEGAFFLVTNGGEKKIPYRFRVSPGISGRTLTELLTAQDFGKIAKQDMDMALRLFEYQDFVEAPFMQDMHIRAIYDGLKGHSNRPNLLEEFLVALRVKDAVSLSSEEELIEYHELQAPFNGALKIKSSIWGYVQFEVAADGDFLELPKKSFTTQDFKNGVCQVAYTVNPARLHKGKNMGALTVSTIRESFSVRFEVQGEDPNKDSSLLLWQEELNRYLMVRLEYETGLYEDRLLLNQMFQAIERMRRHLGENPLTQLLYGELCLMQGHKDEALTVLDECRNQIYDARQEQVEWYCYYQYLLFQVQKKDGQRDTLIRLIRKYLMEEKGHAYLFFLWLKLEPSMKDDPHNLLVRLEELFQEPCSSPFLYLTVFQLFDRDRSLFRKIDTFELQVLYFAAKRDLIDKDLAFQAARMSGSIRHSYGLYYRIMSRLYEKYPEKELLDAICSVLIRGDCRTPEYFHWYRDALKQGISLTRLYEYFLYALPADYDILLPKEVLLYFSYEKDLDDKTRLILYTNILKYMKPEASLYGQYERDMEQFAMEQLLESRINRRLVLLYQRMIYQEMIDGKVARVLPGILRSYGVRLKNQNIKYVVVRYEELEGEDAFPIRDGVAYVPLFSEHTVLLFQDAYGNRYTNIPYRKYPAMDKGNIQELEDRCYDLYPGHPMLRLQECEEIVAAGVRNEADAVTLRRATAELGLHPLSKKRMLSRLIEYYQKQIRSDEQLDVSDLEFLLELDQSRLSRQERAAVCEILIQKDYIQEAYDCIRQYGCEGIRSSRLLKLCTKMILNRLFDEDDILLQLACLVFSEEKYDGVVLDYLCEHFNGSTKQMYKVLNQGIREHVDVYDMPERLLAQMLFTGETGRMDQVFDWYASGRTTSDNIVRAYFTLKSADYFLHDGATDDKVFAWLEGALNGTSDKSRVPTIYLLALTRYYAGLKQLTAAQSELCRDILELLLSEDRIFPYFKQLGRLVPIPDSIMDHVMVEYKGSKDSRPELWVRVLPEEEEYTYEEMKRVYPGVFIRQKVLFEGELMEYQIYEKRDGKRTLLKEGSVARDPDEGCQKDSRFTVLNDMGLCLSLKEEGALKDKMKKYAADSAIAEELFSLL